MLQRIALCTLVCLTFTLPVKGAAVIVDDNFDGYADQAAFEAAWNPDFGDGRFDLTGLATAGRLVPDPGNADITPPNDDPPGIQGKAVALKGLINESKESFSLVPTATEFIKFGGDLFTDGGQGKKLTVALRNDTVERELGVFGMNYVELGFGMH